MVIDFLWIDEVEEIPIFVRKFIERTNTKENSTLIKEQEMLLLAYSLYLYTMAPLEEMNMMILSLLPDDNEEETARLFEGAAEDLSGEVAAKAYGEYKSCGANHADVVELLRSRFHEDIKIAGAIAFYAPEGHEEAVLYYSEYLAETEHPLLYALRAQHLGALDRNDEAFQDYEKALEFAPKEYKAWLHLQRGYTYDKLERYNEEVAECTAALEIDPDYAGAYLQRSQTYSVLNKYNEALADAESAEACGSCSAFLFNWLAVIAVESDCTPQKGLELSEKAIESDPEESANYYLRAGWKAELGDLGGALTDIDTAIGMLPDDKEYLEMKEKILNAKGE